MESKLTDEEIFKFRLELFTDGRMELDQLKNCQSNAIIWGVAAATTIFSILNISDKNPAQYPFLLLIPLIVIFPSWIIFFDKSRTISRLTAFLRLQEKLAVMKSPECVLGWETALEKYWAEHEKFKIGTKYRENVDTALRNAPESRKRISSHIYWGMAFFIFLLLAVISLSLTGVYIGRVEIIVLLATGFLIFWFSFIRKIRKGNLNFLSGLSNYSFREILDLAIKFFYRFLVIEIVMIAGYALWLFMTDPGSGFLTSLESMLVFIFALGLFMVISLTTFYIFINLIRGRYATSVYELRWTVVLGVSPELKSQIKKSISRESQTTFDQICIYT
jgi:hypothetical protein